MGIIKKLSFQNRIFIIISAIMIIIQLMLISSFYIYVSSIFKQKEITSIEQTIDRITSKMDSLVMGMNLISSQLLYNEDVQNALAEARDNSSISQNYFDMNFDSAKKLRTVLVSINGVKSTMVRVGIFNENGDCISLGRTQSNSNEFRKNLPQFDWLSGISQTLDKSILLPPHDDSWAYPKEKCIVISFIRELFHTFSTGNHLGYVEVQQPYSQIEEICTSNMPGKLSIFIVDRNGSIIYPINAANSKEVDYYTKLDASKGEILTRPWDASKELIYTKLSQNTGLKTVIVRPINDFLYPVNIFRNILLAVGFTFLLTTLFIIYAITFRMTSPIREMRKLIKEVTLENLSVKLGTQTENNEIIMLNEAFNKTLARLKESMNQVIEAKSGEAHAHLLALQSQMNPHFIFNTLMSISTLASEIGNWEIVKVCSQLSEMLRYTAAFEKGITTLEKEIEHSVNYLKLIKLRYEDHLEFIIELDERINEIKLPKLILQPIIENCISHGFKNSYPPYKINIKGVIENNHWKVTVSDNGCGFDETSRDRIFEQVGQYRNEAYSGKVFDRLEIGGMGLMNIYLRLSLFYGSETIFEIYNMPDGGATVVIGGAF